MNPRFEWNPQKAAKNLQKHGISFEEASTVFSDPLYITFLDEEHSLNEDRYVTTGQSSQHRLLVVAHTEETERIRIISTRQATNHEKRFYEEAQ